ncbi:hypothetical protein KV203_09430 [Skermania piniformis]|uniref:N-acetyltransferase domain-containing protein n=2 Tax=Skermania pinensis TaxID=39122 RepID=A0ABX8SD21_9ACTN|nr:hypothetical protein KV203_09430 [Skermania piniformis]
MIEEFWDLYEIAFGPLRTRAAARHVLYKDEFWEEMTDSRILKYVAWSADGEPLGLTTLTNTLEAVPWISPEYFTSRYPDHAARDALYYLGFTLVTQSARHTDAFRMMAQAMMDRLVAEQAVAFCDICSFNVSRGHARAINSIMQSHGAVEVGRLDQQNYYSATFAGAG